MNVSMAAALFSIDAASGPQAASDADAKGEGFGLAVKDAASKHGGKRAGAKEAPARGAHGDAKPAADSTKDADGAKGDEPDAAAATPADVLGRLLGMAAATPLPEPRAEHSEGGGESAGGDGASDDALNERIVISTVADLANSPAEAGANAKRVSLRVTGMETHFEPRIDGATLVEAAKDKPAATVPATGTGEGTTTAAPKQAFKEILQNLGSGAADSEGGGADAQEARSGGDRAQALRTSARVQADTSTAQNKAAGAVVERSQPQAKEPTTGQIVNAQIAERIVEAFAPSSEASAASGASRTATASDQLLRMTAGGAALKTLSIQLEPQNLGRVDVAMRLVDGRLQVELAASEPSTAAALAGDRHGLRKILEHAGFALDDAAISIVARDPGQGTSTPAAATAGTDSGRQPGGGDSAFGRSSDGRSSAERQPQDGRRRQSDGGERTETSERSNARSGDVYL